MSQNAQVALSINITAQQGGVLPPYLLGEEGQGLELNPELEPKPDPPHIQRFYSYREQCVDSRECREREGERKRDRGERNDNA